MNKLQFKKDWKNYIWKKNSVVFQKNVREKLVLENGLEKLRSRKNNWKMLFQNQVFKKW